MFLSVTARALLGLSLAATAAESNAPVGSDEILSHACAVSVSTMVEMGARPGPVFSEVIRPAIEDFQRKDNGSLVFTSTEVQGGGKFLIVSAGSGIYAIQLRHAGVNRLRFELATQRTYKKQFFFISFVHDGFRSRYFDFSVNRAPTGRDDIDYEMAKVSRADYMLPNFDYAIFETTENTLNAMTDGRIRREQMLRKRIENCEHISRKAPNVARNLNHNIDVLEMMVMGPKPAPVVVKTAPASSSRMPASVARAK